MSLTQAERVFGSIHETAVNDLLVAYFTARPRYLNYSSSPMLLPPGTPFVPMPPIAFPGLPGGIHFGVRFELPNVDITPDSSAGGSPLPPGPSQITIKTRVTLIISCSRQNERFGRSGHPVLTTPLAAELDVFARGRLVVTGIGSGAGTIGFEVQEVELVDITPDSLESVLECLIRMMLQGALSSIQIPVESLLLEFIPLPLNLVRGPLAEVDEARVFANI